MPSPGGSSEPGAAVMVGPTADTGRPTASSSPTLVLPEPGPRMRGSGGGWGGGGSPMLKLTNDRAYRPCASVTDTPQATERRPNGVPESRPVGLSVRPPNAQLGGVGVHVYPGVPPSATSCTANGWPAGRN